MTAEVSPRAEPVRAVAAVAGRPLPPAYTVALAVVLAVAAAYGLAADDAYRLPADVSSQARGQDLLTLLALPALVLAAVRARAGSLPAHLLWLGLQLYVAYGYAMYAFSVPHNDAFLLYTAALTMSGYGLLDGLLRVDVTAVAPAFADTPRRAASWVLLGTGVAFAALWLADILPALGGGVPDALFPGDQPNPVYVLDLGVLLPVLVTAGLLLRRGHPAGPVLGAVLLCKAFTLSVACLFMAGFMVADGHDTDPVLLVMFVALTALTATLLALGVRRLRPVPAGWLRRGLWP
jgi:hypothetical protein